MSYKLYNEDCLKVLPTIDDKSVNLVLADLPFGTTRRNKWDNIIPFESLWKEYKRILADKGAILLFGDEPFATKLRASNYKWYRYDWYWIKGGSPTGFLNARRMPLKKVETISVFYPKLPLYNPQKTKGKPYKAQQASTTTNYGIVKQTHILTDNKGDRFPTNVLNFNKVQRGDHPTQKPVELLEYLIKTYTNEDMIVLDNTMGSGSTGVACKNTNRNFIGMELDKKYFDIAKERINNAN